MMDSSTMIFTIVLILMATTVADGQINRYINPAWLEMDANSEYYPGGEVISQVLQAYGLGDSYGSSRYRSSVIDRNGYGRSYPRNRIVNNLNNAYDSDPLTQEYFDRNYDYVDNSIRGSSRYRNSLLQNTPRRNRINMITMPRTTYYPSENIDQDLQSQSYSRSRLAAIVDPVTSQELGLRNRETARLIPRSTVAPTANTDEKRKI